MNTAPTTSGGQTTTPSPAQLINHETSTKQGNLFNTCLDWWLRLTAIPEAPVTASFIQREHAQKVRRLSIVVLILLFITTLLFLPSAALSTIPSALAGCLCLMFLFLIALFINKQFQRPVLAGVLVTLGIELVLATLILSIRPPDELTVQGCTLLVLGDIVAITLVSRRFMFLVSFCNCIFSMFSLFYLKYSLPYFNDPNVPISQVTWIGPVSVQLIIAFVVGWHVNYLNKEAKRADRAQMVAALEHKIAEQQKARNKEMQHLVDCISSISSQYSDMTSRRVITRISDEGFPGILKPLTTGFNMLLSRLQHANQTEREYHTLLQALQHCMDQISQGYFAPDNSLQTGTQLDLLLTALHDRGYIHTRTQLQQDQSTSPPPSAFFYQNPQKPFEK